MSLNQPPITDERQLPLPEPSGDGAGPATDPDERPSSGGPRLALPPIEWARVWRAVRLGLRAGIVVVVVSVALGTAAFVAAGFYGQYGAVRNAPDTASWAALAPRFAGQTLCTSCHAPESDAQATSAHLQVSCESCHGPAAAHASDATAASAALLIRPTSGICVTCHAATAGRPATFPQVDTNRHYSGGECLRCHGPHSILAVRPPIVSHPLANLPECTTCHAPDGLKKIPSGHMLVADRICLSCHGPSADGKL